MIDRALVRRLAVGRNLKWTLVRAVATALFLAVVCTWVVRPAWTDGQSMEPTIHDHRLHFLWLWAYRGREPLRHDIVAIRGLGNRVFLLKRVVGLPGEMVAFRNGQVFVNGERLDEPYVEYRGNWTLAPFEVPGDEYFIVGDNRAIPSGHHVMGTVKRSAIYARFLW